MKITDRERYDQLCAEMRRLTEAGHFEQLQIVWKQIEEIKNRHGGFPPPK